MKIQHLGLHDTVTRHFIYPPLRTFTLWYHTSRGREAGSTRVTLSLQLGEDCAQCWPISMYLNIFVSNSGITLEDGLEYFLNMAKHDRGFGRASFCIQHSLFLIIRGKSPRILRKLEWTLIILMWFTSSRESYHKSFVRWPLTKSCVFFRPDEVMIPELFNQSSH